MSDGEHSFKNIKDEDSKIFFEDTTVQAVLLGLLADGTQVAIDSSKISHLLKDMKNLKFYIKTTGDKRYIIFKGYASLRNVLTGTRYLTTTSTVAPLINVLDTTIKFKTVLNGVGVTVIVASAIEIGKFALMEENERDFTDLLVTLITGVTKAVVAFIIGTLAMIVAVELGAVALVIVGVGIIAGIIASIGLNYTDDKVGITKVLQDYINDCQRKINQAIENKKRTVLNNVSDKIDNLIKGSIEYTKKKAIEKIEEAFSQLFQPKWWY